MSTDPAPTHGCSSSLLCFLHLGPLGRARRTKFSIHGQALIECCTDLLRRLLTDSRRNLRLKNASRSPNYTEATNKASGCLPWHVPITTPLERAPGRQSRLIPNKAPVFCFGLSPEQLQEASHQELPETGKREVLNL